MTHKLINAVSLNRKYGFCRLKVLLDMSFDRTFPKPQVKLYQVMMPADWSLMKCHVGMSCDILGPTHRYLCDVNIARSVGGYSAELCLLFIDSQIVGYEQDEGEKHLMRNFIIWTNQKLLGLVNKGGVRWVGDVACMWGDEKCTGYKLFVGKS